MTTAVLDFPTTSPPQGNSRPILVQLELTPEFVATIDAWRRSRPVSPPRTRTLVELAAIGLADQASSAAKAAKRKRR
jgi:hypothetical protein